MSTRLVLVTGGAGFIGSNVVAELAADPDFDVAVCDRLGEAALGKWRNLARHSIADFVEPEALFAWLDGRGRDTAVIVHMGAISSTTEPDADRIIATNFGISRDLFDWCAHHGRAFIYASSAATYGDGAGGFEDDQSLDKLAALRPLNAYGWSKAVFDRYAVREAGRGHSPRQWTGLKFFNVYGPNEAHKDAMRSVVAKIWPDIAQGRPVRLFRSHRAGWADGGQQRDFIYVRDVAKVVAWLVRSGEVSGLFNLGTGQARSFRDLATAAWKAAGSAPQIEFVDMPGGLEEQYQYFTEARMERLREAGWAEGFTSLEEGVADYVTRYLATADPYR
jgi:ADP-L-glycero-D-manno-heptose 6-epimerase